MSAINSYMLQKMGWFKYNPVIGLGYEFPGLFSNDLFVRYFFVDRENSNQVRIFIIKEMTIEEKQKSKKEYKFIQIDIKEFTTKAFCKLIDIEKSKIQVDNFANNSQLWKLVIEKEAFGEHYQRHFRLNKILK